MMEVRTLLKMSVNAGHNYRFQETADKGEKVLLVDLCPPDGNENQGKINQALSQKMEAYLNRMGKSFEYISGGTCLKVSV